MAMFPTRLDRIDDKLDAFEAAVNTAVAGTRSVNKGLIPYTDRAETDLTDGCWNIVAASEGDYHLGRGMAAKEGTLRINLVGHVRVAEDATRAELQQAEIDMAEEAKGIVRTGVAGMTLAIDQVILSRLLEHPYGWVVALIELQPPAASTH